MIDNFRVMIWLWIGMWFCWVLFASMSMLSFHKFQRLTALNGFVEMLLIWLYHLTSRCWRPMVTLLSNSLNFSSILRDSSLMSLLFNEIIFIVSRLVMACRSLFSNTISVMRANFSSNVACRFSPWAAIVLWSLLTLPSHSEFSLMPD